MNMDCFQLQELPVGRKRCSVIVCTCRSTPVSFTRLYHVHTWEDIARVAVWSVYHSLVSTGVRSVKTKLNGLAFCQRIQGPVATQVHLWATLSPS